jgi:hypothetical protein
MEAIKVIPEIIKRSRLMLSEVECFDVSALIIRIFYRWI